MQPNLGAVTMKQVFRDHDLLSVALLFGLPKTRKFTDAELRAKLEPPGTVPL
jgi:hypothetical protein